MPPIWLCDIWRRILITLEPTQLVLGLSQRTGDSRRRKTLLGGGVKLDRGHPGVRLVSALCNLADGSDPEAKEVAQLTSILDDESYGYVKLELLRLGRLPLDRKS
jgi:hypothetical protein